MFSADSTTALRGFSTRPLPDYPSNDKATDADKVAVFNALYLNTGTYTVTGNMLATKAMVAKSNRQLAARAISMNLRRTGTR